MDAGPLRPNAVLFDFGGVFVPSPFGTFERLERAGALPAGFLRAVNSRNPDTNAWAQLERGEIGVEQFCEKFAAEARVVGHEVDARAVVEPILSPLVPEDRAVPEMLAVARSCRTLGVRTALVTNNVLPLRRGDDATAADWVFDTFDAVVESCLVGTRKPEPAVYRAALDALDVGAADAVMLDDLGINLKPARAMGMRTIKVTDPVEAAQELTALLALPTG